MDNVYFTRHSKKPVEVSNRKRLAAFTLHSGVEPSCLAKSDIVIDLIDYKCFFYDCWGESSGTTFQDAMEPPWPRLFSGSTLTLNVVFEAFIYRFIIFILKKDEGMEAGGGGGVLTQIFELHSDSSVLHPHARVYWSTFSKLFDPAFQVS